MSRSLRRLAWWILITGFALTASWWLPRLEAHAQAAAPTRPPAIASAVIAEDPADPAPDPHSTLEPPEDSDIDILPIGPDDVFPQVTEWMTEKLAETLKSMAESVSKDTIMMRLESLSIMNPADPAGFHGLSFAVARAAMLLLVTAGAFWIMTHETLQNRVTMKELAPRILVGFVAMELSLQILRLAVVHANALVDAILSVGFGGQPTEAIAQTLRSIADTSSGTESWILLTLVIGLLVMLTALLVGVVSRSLLLMLLAITAPMALACHALPATEIVARTWWKALLACVLSAIGQALILVLWVRLFFRGETLVSNPLLLPASISQYADMVLVMALLWLMNKALSIPMKRAFASTGGSPLGPIGQAVRGIVMAKTFGALGGGASAVTKSRIPGSVAEGARPSVVDVAKFPPARRIHQIETALREPTFVPPAGPPTGRPARRHINDSDSETKDRLRPSVQDRPRLALRAAVPQTAPARAGAGAASGNDFVARRPFLPPLPRPRRRPNDRLPVSPRRFPKEARS